MIYKFLVFSLIEFQMIMRITNFFRSIQPKHLAQEFFNILNNKSLIV